MGYGNNFCHYIRKSFPTLEVSGSINISFCIIDTETLWTFLVKLKHHITPKEKKKEKQTKLSLSGFFCPTNILPMSNTRTVHIAHLYSVQRNCILMRIASFTSLQTSANLSLWINEFSHKEQLQQLFEPWWSNPIKIFKTFSSQPFLILSNFSNSQINPHLVEDSSLGKPKSLS